MQMPGYKTILTIMVITLGNRHRQNGLTTRHLHENHPSLHPLSPQNGVTSNLRLGTVCGFLVFDYAEAEVAKYERSMWKILVKLKKFAKVSESLIKFLYFLKLRSLTVALPIRMCQSQN